MGLVYLALASADEAWSRELHIARSRSVNREVSAQAALDMLRRFECDLPVGERA